MEQISADGLRFVDAFSRERVFSGVNMVDKRRFVTGEERFPVEFTEELLEKLKSRGVNLIRLGFTWGMIEPEPERYNKVYLDSVDDVLDKLARQGIYALLDVHQDLFSGFGADGNGDGAPPWACLSDGYKSKPIRFTWDEKYWWDKAVHHSFDHFWENAPCLGKGLLDRYAALWQHLAERFGSKPALFGFDLINEPFPGTAGGKIFRRLIRSFLKVSLTDRQISKRRLLGDLLHPDRREHLFDPYSGEILSRIVLAAEPWVKEFDTQLYLPFLNRMTTAIRQVTDRGIIAIENCYYSNLGIPCSVNPIEISGEREPLQCFAPHGYDLMVDSEAYIHASNDRITAIFDEHYRTWQRLQLPVLVGEWGGFDSSNPLYVQHMKHILKIIDANGWSQTYWHYDEGLLDGPLTEVFSRPYPIAICGTRISCIHNGENRTFTLSYRQKEPSGKPTLLFSPVQPQTVLLDGREIRVPYRNYELQFYTNPGDHTILLRY